MNWPRAAVVAVLLLGAPRAGAQSREQVDRLAALGQVWGFLKYYHPGVAKGTIHWDSALVVPTQRISGRRSPGANNDDAGTSETAGSAP